MLIIPAIAGILLGKKQKKIDECQRRCKSWFSGMPDVERSCKNACKNNTELSKDEFLCSGNYIEEALLIARYGYDPCPNQGLDVPTYLDPLQDRPREDVKNAQLKEVAVILGIVAGAGLLILLLLTVVKK